MERPLDHRPRRSATPSCRSEQVAAGDDGALDGGDDRGADGQSGSHVADERGSGTVDPASTWRRLQRFFQHVRLPVDWAAPMIARLAGGADKRTLVMDRTNWKVGQTHVNLLVLAIRTRHSQVPLMWVVLDRAG